MSIATEIVKLQNTKTNIKEAIRYCGIDLLDSETIHNYYRYIESLGKAETGSFTVVPNLTITSNTIRAASSRTSSPELNSVTLWITDLDDFAIDGTSETLLFLAGHHNYNYAQNYAEIFVVDIAITVKKEADIIRFYNRVNDFVLTTSGASGTSAYDGSFTITCTNNNIIIPTNLTGTGTGSGLGPGV